MRRVSGCCSLLQGPAACLSGDLPNSLVRLPLPCWHPWVGVRMAQGGWDLVTSLEASPWEGQELWPPPPGLGGARGSCLRKGQPCYTRCVSLDNR